MNFQLTTLIRGFSQYTQKQLEQTKQDLSLFMPLPLLEACAAYYKRQPGNRQPTLEELRLLDALAALPPKSEEIAIRELYANDSFVAQTYADMMKKRRELKPHATRPITIGEAFALAGDYLNSIGKNTTEKRASIAPAHTPIPHEAPYVSANGSDTALLPSSPAELCINDLFLLVSSNGKDAENLRSKLYGLLADPTLQPLCKRMEKIPKAGILPLVLSMCNGAAFSSERVHIFGSAPIMGSLVNAFAGNYLLVIAPQDCERLMEALQSEELVSAVIGSVSAQACISITSATQMLPVTFEVGFLRSLLLRVPMIAKLPGEPFGRGDRVIGSAANRLTSAYVKSAAQPLERISFQNGAVSAAHCQTEVGFFRSALNAVLLPVLSLSAAGGDYTQASLAAKLTLPERLYGNSKQIGEALSTVLGFYRAQTELALSAVALSVEQDNAAEHPAVTVYSLSDASAQPAAFTGSGHFLYCVALPLDSNALPQFDALRSLLKTLCQLCTNGAICASHVLCNETPKNALEHMSTNAVGYYSEEGITAPDQPLSLAVLLESTEELPFTRLGTTIDLQAPEAEEFPEQPTLPTPTAALTYDGKFTVTVIACGDDKEAESLAALLRRKGARVSLIPSDADAARQARAILLSQVIFLCNTAVSDSPAVLFALQAMQQAGGSLVGLGTHAAVPEGCPMYAMEHSIPEETIDLLFETPAISG